MTVRLFTLYWWQLYNIHFVLHLHVFVLRLLLTNNAKNFTDDDNYNNSVIENYLTFFLTTSVLQYVTVVLLCVNIVANEQYKLKCDQRRCLMYDSGIQVKIRFTPQLFKITQRMWDSRSLNIFLVRKSFLQFSIS